MESRKKYMKEYNQREDVKARKAEFMRKARNVANEDASKRLVRLLLDVGFEDLAFEYALERAPDMLASEKVRNRTISRKK